MKKGTSHLDWAISMGIFLIALISIFVYLNPLSRNIYTGEELVDLVKEEFDKEAYWVIKKLPLFVDDCLLNPGEVYRIDLVFQNGWRDEEDKSSVTIDRVGVNITHLHNLDSEKDFDVLLSVSPLHCGDEARLGAVENIRGLSDELINALKNKDYNLLRDEWRFPPGRDFAIFLDDEKIIGGTLYERANVFADQSKELVVSKNGLLNEVVVSFRVW